MPHKRAIAITEEIAQVAINPRVKDLIEELGQIIASDMLASGKSSEQTTAALNGLRKEFRDLSRALERYQHNTGAKLHTMANHIMALEQQLFEITEAIEDAPSSRCV